MRLYFFTGSLFALFFISLLVSGCGGPEEAKIYRIARDRSWYPLNLLGKERNMLAFTDELIYTIADNEGFKVDLDSAPHNALTENLDRGIFDAIVTFERPTQRLKRKYEFSDTFFLLGPILVVQIDSKAQSLEDMKNQVVGIEPRTSVNYRVDNTNGIIFIPYETILFALRNLAEDQIDGVIMESLPAHEYVDSFYQGELRVVPPPLTDDGLRLMTRREPLEKDMIEHFNRGLQKLIDDGTYQRLLIKWGLFDPSTYTGAENYDI